jgi:hypothetical protein
MSLDVEHVKIHKQLIIKNQVIMYHTYNNKTADNKQKSYNIMRMTMIAAQGKVKPHTEIIFGLNLAAVKIATIQVIMLPL